MPTLYITIAENGNAGSPSYSLKADRIVHVYNRLVTINALPTPEGTAPNRFSLDLGMATEEITVSGIADSTAPSPDDGSPTKSQLETVCREWWTLGANDTDFPFLTIESGSSYYVAIKNASFEKLGALEDRWNFSITFMVKVKA